MSDTPEQCPFCKATRDVLPSLRSKADDIWAVICYGCLARGPRMIGKQAAIDAWNALAADGEYITSRAEQQAHEAALQERLAAAQEKIAALVKAAKLVADYGDIWEAENTITDSELEMVNACRAAIAAAREVMGGEA